MTAWLKDVIGYGLHAARPAAGSEGRVYYETDTDTLLRDNGATWDTLALSGGGVTQQLDYNLATDITGASIPAATWTDIISNQTFNVASATSHVLISVNGNILGFNYAGINDFGVRLVVDSAGTPINKFVCGGRQPASSYVNLLVGAGIVSFSGLSVGSHTVKLQCNSNGGAGVIYCQPSSSPNNYGLHICVLECA